MHDVQEGLLRLIDTIHIHQAETTSFGKRDTDQRVIQGVITVSTRRPRSGRGTEAQYHILQFTALRCVVFCWEFAVSDPYGGCCKAVLVFDGRDITWDQVPLVGLFIQFSKFYMQL